MLTTFDPAHDTTAVIQAESVSGRESYHNCAAHLHVCVTSAAAAVETEVIRHTHTHHVSRLMSQGVRDVHVHCTCSYACKLACCKTLPLQPMALEKQARDRGSRGTARVVGGAGDLEPRPHKLLTQSSPVHLRACGHAASHANLPSSEASPGSLVLLLRLATASRHAGFTTLLPSAASELLLLLKRLMRDLTDMPRRHEEAGPTAPPPLSTHTATRAAGAVTHS